MPNKLTQSRLRKALKKTAAPQTGWMDVFPAVIGTADGTVQTGVPGIIYVRNFLNGQVLSVYNFVTPNTAGLQVEVGRKVETPGLWQVKGVREAYSQPAGGSVSAGSHTHENLFISRDRFLPFIVLPIEGGEFTVQIYGDVFMNSDETAFAVSNQQLDLSSYVPSTGAVYVVIEADADGVIYVNEGTEVSAKELLTLADIPAVTVGRFASCAVRLYAGQVQLYRDPASIDDFIDLRFTNPNLMSDYVKLSRIGSTVRRDLQFMQDVVHSAGWVSGGEITDNGDGTIDVAAGVGLIRATDDNTSELFFMDWSASAGLSLTDDSNNWVYIDYNSGSPQVTVNASQPSENNTVVILALIYRTGTDLHINAGYKHTVGDHAGLMMEAMSETMPFAHASGGAVSEVGTLQFSISQGTWWWGLTKITTSQFDGTSDSFNYYYRDGLGGWTEVSSQTAIDDAHYDDGSGTLANVTTNRYSVHWGFIATEGDVHILYGRNNANTLAEAQEAMVPSDLPPELVADSRFLFKIIVQEGQTSFESIESALDIRFAVTAGGGGAVDSVNGYTGTVVLDPDDLDDTSTTNKFTTAADISKLAGIEAGAEVNDPVRDLLTANRTYYVRTDGSDSNTGLTNSSGGAFLTWEYAISVLKTLDLAGYTVTIEDGNGGTYTGENLVIENIVNGSVVLQGYTQTLAETVASATVAAGSGATKGTVTKTGQFTGDTYDGYLAYFVTDAEWRLIDSNTNDVLTLVGYAPSSTTQNVEIYSPTTNIDGGTSAVATINNQNDITFNDIELESTVAGTAYEGGVLLYNAKNITFNRCWMNASVNTSIYSRAYSLYCFWDTSINNQCRTILYSQMQLDQCLLKSSAAINTICWYYGQVNLANGTVIDGGSTYGFNIRYRGQGVAYLYNAIRNCGTGIYAEIFSTGVLTANVQYSGNSTNENADATSYID